MDAIEEVRHRLSVEDVVSQYVQLKRSGRNFKGLSPFSNEKTASLMVSPEKQIWHDFSSGKGGNIFSFVMEIEGLDFKEALELLARQAGIDMSQYQTSRRGLASSEKEKVYEVLDAATRFYQVHLTKSKTALEYLIKTRGFSKDIIVEFQLGYSPNNGTALVDYLSRKNFTPQQIRRAGLAVTRSNHLSDMFRGRVMIPLADPMGRVIGFTARAIIESSDSPKYINTPQTILYDKSRHVYGLHLAKQAIRENKYAVIVEGNLDVIASHQAGVKQVVATAGTALTEYHLKGLSRFSNDVRLNFDNDDAGLKATERAIPIASKVGVSLSVITITGAKDADELIKKDPKQWQSAIDNHEYAVDWLINRHAKLINVESGQGKREFSDLILPVIGQINDQVEKEHYLSKVAKLIGVSKEALETKLSESDSKAKPTTRRKTNTPPADIDQNQLDLKKIQDHILALSFVQPKLRNILEPISDDMFSDDSAKKLLQYLKSNSDASVSINTDKNLQSIADYIKILLLQYEELYGDLDQIELQYEASRLQTQLIQHYVKTKKRLLAGQMQNASEPITDELLNQAKQLDKLLKTMKGSQ